MRLRLALLMFAVAARNVPAQSNDVPVTTADKVVLTKLFDPIYPPLALQARINGEVEITLAIRRDGSVESTAFVSGHPMLKEAALDSARRSQFECRDCTEAVTTFPLKYKFRITSRGDPKDCDGRNDPPPAPEIDPVLHEVTVTGWAIALCDPSAEIFRVRSAKCLYLWRCSTHYGE